MKKKGFVMKTFEQACPVCGHLNRDLYLEDTGGWMECEKCSMITMDSKFLKGKKIPVYLLNDMTKEFDTVPVVGTVSC